MSRNNDNRWYAKDTGSDYWYVESREKSMNIRAHCICCAYIQAIEQYGGDCDLRGLSGYGVCYEFLAVVVRNSRDGKNDTIAEDANESR